MHSLIKNINKFNNKLSFAYTTTRPIVLPGKAQYQENTKNVNLRGIHLKGKYNDLPNLIFFAEHCDTNQNWVNFFANPENKILDYRNVYILSPRNFGRSDRNPSYDLAEQADDVVRFMYENQISTATLGGHGFGGKLALAVGCYHVDRVSGVFNFDTAPIDHRGFESFQEFQQNIRTLKDIELKGASLKDIDLQLNNQIEDPKWRRIFYQNLVRDDKSGNFTWNFELDYLHHNVTFNREDSIGNWARKHGLYTGRYLSVFAEYSRWVHLNTNTMRYFHVCTRTKGFGHDLFYIQGDENPLNHWFYDFEQSEFVASRKLLKFLTMYDGVHVLLKDRSEIGNYFIPDITNSRINADGKHVYGDYSPAHYHHNWRFNNIYERAEKAKNE